MSPPVAVALHVLVNAVLPFAVALALVLLVLRVFPVRPGKVQLAVLLLPLAKIGWEAAQGVSERSFLWAHLAGLVRESGTMGLGVGASAPAALHLRALMTARVGGVDYQLSLGDLAVLGCDRIAPWLGGAALALLLGVATARLIRRIVSSARFERARRCERAAAVASAHHRLGWRWVDVYLMAPGASSRAPCTGGLLRPYVCLPHEPFVGLHPAERVAVLRHELSHVALHHWALLQVLGVITDLCWFVPGMGLLARRVALGCELMADDRAVRTGAGRLELASAMVRVAEHTLRIPAALRPAANHALVLLDSPSELRQRTLRLLQRPAPPGRWTRGLRQRLLQLALLVATAQTVWALVVFNH